MPRPCDREETLFWRNPTLDNLELLRAHYITHAFSPHVHEGYAIGVIEAGAETFRYRHADYVAGSGSVVIINPGEVHTGQAVSAEGWRYRMLYPSAELLRRVASALADRPQDYPFFAAPVIDDPILAQQIGQAHQALEHDDSTLTHDSHLWHMLRHLIQRHADSARAASPLHVQRLQPPLRPAQEYLDANYAHDVRLEALAALVHLSPYHFLRTFKAAVGLSPHAYQTQLRLQHAKGLLANGMAPADVAQQVGFTDQSHLNRHFKRVVGVPPGQYRG
ncbi:MAG: AraC family transcriptional regulator [Caldilineaceae bacterium]